MKELKIIDTFNDKIITSKPIDGSSVNFFN